MNGECSLDNHDKCPGTKADMGLCSCPCHMDEHNEEEQR
jgi:hypothetical protein